MARSGSTHTASRPIAASPAAIYRAFMDRDALATWLPPDGATATIGAFEPRDNGQLRMTLTFAAAPGKSSENTDVVEARFVDLVPDEQIGLAVNFVSQDPEFAGTMTMRWRLQPTPDGTLVSVTADNVPSGIRRSDHEAAMASTLANLAKFLA